MSIRSVAAVACALAGVLNSTGTAVGCPQCKQAAAVRAGIYQDLGVPLLGIASPLLATAVLIGAGCWYLGSGTESEGEGDQHG